MYGYIYQVENKINRKKYIGQSKGKYNNWYLGSGILIKKAIEKYGKENFTKTLIKYAHTKKELNELEIKYISEMNAVDDNSFYNLDEGGRGGDTWTGRHHSKESRMKMSKTKKGHPSPHKGKKFRPRTDEEKFKKMMESPYRKRIMIDGIIYNSKGEAARKTGMYIKPSTIEYYRNRGDHEIIEID